MRKILYWWLSLGIGLAFCCMFLWSSNLNELAATGSSSVLPVMKDYSNKYFNDKKILVNVNSGGSGKGLDDTIHNHSDLGNMSSDKSHDILSNKSNLANWTTNKDRTITLNKDAIAMMINLPKELRDKGNDAPIMNATALASLYKGNKISWAQLLKNSWASDDNSTDIIPLGRSGGSATSGTSEAFFNGLSNLSKVNFTTADKNHNHNNIITTNEANSQALSKLSDVSGSITYLSLGFALVNSSSSIKVSNIYGYQKDGKEATMIATINNAQSGIYQWVRPFNTAFSFNNKHINWIIGFVTFVLNDQKNNKNNSIVAKDHYVLLTDQEIDDQIATLQAHYSDVMLHNATAKDSYYKYQKYAFGIKP